MSEYVVASSVDRRDTVMCVDRTRGSWALRGPARRDRDAAIATPTGSGIGMSDRRASRDSGVTAHRAAAAAHGFGSHAFSPLSPRFSRIRPAGLARPTARPAVSVTPHNRTASTVRSALEPIRSAVRFHSIPGPTGGGSREGCWGDLIASVGVEQAQQLGRLLVRGARRRR